MNERKFQIFYLEHATTGRIISPNSLPESRIIQVLSSAANRTQVINFVNSNKERVNE